MTTTVPRLVDGDALGPAGVDGHLAEALVVGVGHGDVVGTRAGSRCSSQKVSGRPQVRSTNWSTHDEVARADVLVQRARRARPEDGADAGLAHDVEVGPVVDAVRRMAVVGAVAGEERDPAVADGADEQGARRLAVRACRGGPPRCRRGTRRSRCRRRRRCRRWRRPRHALSPTWTCGTRRGRRRFESVAGLSSLLTESLVVELSRTSTSRTSRWSLELEDEPDDVALLRTTGVGLVEARALEADADVAVHLLEPALALGAGLEGSSVKDWTTSSSWPHSLQRYW